MGHTDGWSDVPIQSLGKVVTGTTPSSKLPDVWGDDYPFITPTDLSYDVPFVAPTRGVSETGRQRLRTRMIPVGSVCFTCIGATIGKVCLTSTHSITNQQINSIVVDSTVADPRFLFYKLRHDAERIRNLAGGAATPIINKTTFSSIRLTLPPVDVQRRIASILFAYDDLIAKNTRRIAILEDMARTVYREWFVAFRYPGHETVPLVESASGPIPDGWHVGRLSAEVEHVRENISAEDLNDHIVAHFGFEAHDLERLPTLEEGTELMSGKLVLEEDSVLIAKLNPRIKRVWLAYVDPATLAVTSGEFLVLRPKSDWTLEYIFALVDSVDFQGVFGTYALGTSASHQRVKPADALGIRVVLPGGEVMSEFGSFAEPTYRLAHTLRLQCEKLRAIRDSLLPRLVSGEVDVSEVDVAVGDVA